MLVAIHQPNFFPWLGYFNKITRCDKFILLDNVQFQKTGGNYANRVKIVVGGKEKWITAPVDRSYHGTRLINKIRLKASPGWQDGITGSIRAGYGKAPFFKEVFPVMSECLNYETGMLSGLNLYSLGMVSELLGLDRSKLIPASTLPGRGYKTELLISLIKAAGGTAYLSGEGGFAYQDEDMFRAAGIELIRQNFEHPEYPQFNTEKFIPGLSVIDALMNCGVGKTKKLLDI